MPQRILVHDYQGHPFQPPLSRRLASRGHEILHVYSQSVLSPQGALLRSESDPESMRFSGIRLPTMVDKQAYVRRYFQERAYGQLLGRKIREFQPDVVTSSNAPLEVQACAIKAAHAVGARFVFWLQDVHGIAIESLLGARFGAAGRIIGRYYTWMEKRLLRSSDAVIAITEDFAPVLESWGADADAVHVIPNWASMDELPERPKNNPWARAHGLAGKFCFLYSGTIGLKHDPELLLKLALNYRDQADVAVVVVSEGAKAEWLGRRKIELGLEGLRIFPFQPYADVPDVMGTADVLVAILDVEAGRFSVPSKVLAYHCASRPLLLAVPSGNLAARIVTQARSGVVVEPANAEGFLRAAETLRGSASQRLQFGRNALRYAEETFDLERIADRFESLLHSLPRSGAETREISDEHPQAI